MYRILCSAKSPEGYRCTRSSLHGRVTHHDDQGRYWEYKTKREDESARHYEMYHEMHRRDEGFKKIKEMTLDPDSHPTKTLMNILEYLEKEFL